MAERTQIRLAEGPLIHLANHVQLSATASSCQMTESCLGFASEENVIISLFFAKRCIEKLSLVAELFANVLLKLGK